MSLKSRLSVDNIISNGIRYSDNHYKESKEPFGSKSFLTYQGNLGITTISRIKSELLSLNFYLFSIIYFTIV